jgi:hypothetical protein
MRSFATRHKLKPYTFEIGNQLADFSRHYAEEMFVITGGDRYLVANNSSTNGSAS